MALSISDNNAVRKLMQALPVC